MGERCVIKFIHPICIYIQSEMTLLYFEGNGSKVDSMALILLYVQCSEEIMIPIFAQPGKSK